MHVPHSTGNGSSNGSTAHAWQPPYKRSEPQEPSAELMERIREAGVDSWQDTGLQYLSDDARVRLSAHGSHTCPSNYPSSGTGPGRLIISLDSPAGPCSRLWLA